MIAECNNNHTPANWQKSVESEALATRDFWLQRRVFLSVYCTSKMTTGGKKEGTAVNSFNEQSLLVSAYAWEIFLTV